MSRLNVLTKKEFHKLRSGQVFWHVSVNQFNEYKVVQHTCLGKIANYNLETIEGPVNPIRQFFSKKPQLNRLFNIHSGEILIYPEYELLKTRRAAQTLIDGHKAGLYPDSMLSKVVRRIRKPQIPIEQGQSTELPSIVVSTLTGVNDVSGIAG